MNNRTKIVEGYIKKEEIPMIAARFNIGDKFKKTTIDGEKVTGTIVGKTDRFCIVKTVGKKECFLWKDLANVK